MASTILIPNQKDEESPILLPKQQTTSYRFKTLSQIEYDSLTKIDSNTIYCILENKEIVKVYTGTNPWNLQETNIVDIPLIGNTGIFPKKYQEALNDDLLKVNGSIIIYKDISKENIDLYTINDKGFIIYTIYIEEETWDSKTVDQNDIKIFNLELNESSGEISEEILNTIKNSDLISINNHLVTYKFIYGIYTELHYYDYNFLYNCVINNDGNITYIIHKINLQNLLSIDLIKQQTGNSNVELMSQKAITRELDKKQNAFDIGRGLELSEDGTLYCTLDDQIFQVVEELPVDGLSNKIYLVNNHSSEQKNVYSEYMWVNAQWEFVGTHNSELNLEDYVTKSDLQEAFEDFCWQVDLYDSELNIKNKNTGESLSINDDIYNTKDFYIVFDEQFYQFITKVIYPKGIICQGNINLQTVGIYMDHYIGIIGVDSSTGKFIQLRFEYAEDIESDQDVYYIYFTDYDYLTSKELTQINNQLEALGSRIDNIPITPIQKTYYEITEVGQLEGISEGSVVYFQQYLEEENVTYGSFQWIDDVSEFVCYTETSNDASTIYSDPNMTHPIYSGQEYKKEIVRDGQTPILYIRTTNDIQIHRCAYNGQYVGPFQYYPGFYIKTSIALKKIASSEDIPVKNSQLENDSKFIHTVNEKKSNNGKLTINADDIVVSGEYIIPDIQGGSASEKIEYSASVNDAIMESLNKGEENFAHISYLYETKLDKNDIPAPETYVLNFTIADGVNTGSYDTTEYTNLLAAIKEGKLVIVKGGATRVTADSQAVADKDAYVVIRYSTPRISDDNTSITISFYELKFGTIDSSGICKYQSKAIHKIIN